MLPRQQNTDAIRRVVRHSEVEPPIAIEVTRRQAVRAPHDLDAMKHGRVASDQHGDLAAGVARDQHLGAAVTRQIRCRALRRAARDLVSASRAKRPVGKPVPGRQRTRTLSGRRRRVARGRKLPSASATRTATWSGFGVIRSARPSPVISAKLMPRYGSPPTSIDVAPENVPSPRPRNSRMDSGDRSSTRRSAWPSESMSCSRTACGCGETLDSSVW